MKHLKRFNEELRTYTYKKAAKKLAEIGHVNRAKSMENYVKKKEEERLKSEKESIDRWEKNVSEYSKFGKLKIDVFEKHETGRWMNGKMSGYFYPVLTFDRDSFEDSMYEYTRPNPKKVGNYTQSSEEKSFPQDFNEVVSLSLGLVPVEDEKELSLFPEYAKSKSNTLDKCKKEMPKSNFENGFYFASWITFSIAVKGDNISVSMNKIENYDDPIIFRIADRKSAGIFRDLLIKIFNGNVNYPSSYTDIKDLHENIETYVCNKSGLSSEYGLDMSHFVNAIKAININSLFKESS